jgi:hypothetical protein
MVDLPEKFETAAKENVTAPAKQVSFLEPEKKDEAAELKLPSALAATTLANSANIVTNKSMKLYL